MNNLPKRLSKHLHPFGSLIESLEARQFMSASGFVQKAVTTIGPTAGVTPAAVQPVFDTMHTHSHTIGDTGTTDADRDTAISITIGAGVSSIDAEHLYRLCVTITNDTTMQVLTNYDQPGHLSDIAKVKTSGAGDVLVIQPRGLLDANTRYTVDINDSSIAAPNQVRDVNGVNFVNFTGDFTTGSYAPHPTADVNQVSFTKLNQSAAGTRPYSAITIGPDGKLYAATTDGNIYRFLIGSNGTLTQDGPAITIINDNNPGGRIITGITFDPGSPTDNVVMWVSHGQHRFGNTPGGSVDVQKSADNFTGKISRINQTANGTWQYQDIIIHIPRSVKDHMNNQIVFSPDKKALYFGLAAMNAMGGDNDTVWGGVVENIYSATIMQLRVGGASGATAYLHAHGAIDLMIDGNPQTATGLVPGTLHYNIFKGSNPLRIWADGVRNDFDMVFATNGHLYAPINGSSAGGNVPATPTFGNVPVGNRIDKDKKDSNGNYLYRDANGYTTYTGPNSAGLTSVPQIEEDALLDVKNGAYYGHPNAARGEYILDAGHTGNANADLYQIGSYPSGQQPDRNYTRPIYDFGQNFSPDGIIQYKAPSNGANAQLDGYLLVDRYSSGSDIIALKPKADGSIDAALTQQRIPGLADLDSPLDLVEDPQTGNIYTTVLTKEVDTGSIVLLKAPAVTGTPTVSASRSKISVQVTPGGKGVTQSVKLTNTGTAPLTLDRSATKITGVNRKNFGVTNLPTTDKTLAPGETLVLTVLGAIAKGDSGIKKGNLALALNDPSLSGGYLIIHLYATAV